MNYKNLEQRLRKCQHAPGLAAPVVAEICLPKTVDFITPRELFMRVKAKKVHLDLPVVQA